MEEVGLLPCHSNRVKRQTEDKSPSGLFKARGRRPIPHRHMGADSILNSTPLPKSSK